MTSAKTDTKELAVQLNHVHKTHWSTSKWFVLSVTTLVILGLGTGAGAWSYNVAQDRAILPKVSIGGVAVSGLPVSEATTRVQAAVDRFLAEKFAFSGTPAQGGERKRFELSIEELGLTIDVAASVARAGELGHNPNHLRNAVDQVSVAFGGGHLPVVTNFDREILGATFDTNFLAIEQPARDARLAFDKDQLVNKDSAYGMEIIRAPVFDELQRQAENLSHADLSLTLGPTAPDIEVADLSASRALAEQVLVAKLNFYYKDKNYAPSRDELASWLEFRTTNPADVLGKAACNCGLPEKKKKRAEPEQLETKDEEVTVPAMVVTPFDQKRLGEKATDPFYVLLMPENFAGRDLRKPIAVVGLNRDKVQHWLLESAAAGLDVPGTNARLAFEGGKVKVTQPSKKGSGVDIDGAIHDLTFALASDKPQVKLALKETKPAINEDVIDELGITKLIGRGISDYSNSSAARITNINVGFEKLSGLVIAPGEEFSTIEAIAPIDGYNGYLPELVITGNKIRPEYGGGLCQVGTTLFRTALDTGLEITERYNHAFAVSHYLWDYPEYGVEATLYDPHPDLRFINDTEGYILLQAYLKDDGFAYVDFYGSDPGRTTTIDGPYRLSGSVSGGGTTTFTYTVTNDATGQVVRREEFISTFQPVSKFKLTR
ncbi:MAG: VanW family protein [Parcubacteria group bacterium]